ncbi:MAG: hypothetical protein HQL32_01020 [Planctomycetes bacterium]|nr:hypothetical protein [Planctomycetota bacterium]
MNKKSIFQLSLASTCLWLASQEIIAKVKAEPFSVETATIVKEKLEVEGKKPKYVYYLKSGEKKILIKDTKKIKKLIGKTVTLKGQAAKKDDMWNVITKVESVKIVKGKAMNKEE